MRLPDRARVVLAQLLRRGAAMDPDVALGQALERMDAALHEVRRSAVDALAQRRAAASERDALTALPREATTALGTRQFERIEARLAMLTRMEQTLRDAERDLHDRSAGIRAARAALIFRRQDAESLRRAAEVAREAEAHAARAREAMRELRERVVAMESQAGDA